MGSSVLYQQTISEHRTQNAYTASKIRTSDLILPQIQIPRGLRPLDRCDRPTIY